MVPGFGTGKTIGSSAASVPARTRSSRVILEAGPSLPSTSGKTRSIALIVPVGSCSPRLARWIARMAFSAVFFLAVASAAVLMIVGSALLNPVSIPSSCAIFANMRLSAIALMPASNLSVKLVNGLTSNFLPAATVSSANS